jgi:polysaccharide deacetylase family protein (PEP-CTERM system associated)
MPELTFTRRNRLRVATQRSVDSPPQATQTILSFDVEEHFLIEAAAGLHLDDGAKEFYRCRVAPPTRWLLDLLERKGVKATFFVVGQIVRHDPDLIRDIHLAGHEVASHGWDHRRIHHHTPESFREDVLRSKDALEQVTGQTVAGYRAPTFSVVPRTAWALDVLSELGLLYDSSIYPVRHDRYGVPRAPRSPFLACGPGREILEIPPLTLRLGGVNVPVGGGGYFRLLPLSVMEYAIRRMSRDCERPVAMLYFHPWEFDPEQPRLPLGRLSRFRTYVGIRRSRSRLDELLSGHCFVRAIDVAKGIGREDRHSLPRFAPDPTGPVPVGPVLA